MTTTSDKPLLSDGLAKALATDYFFLREQLSERQLDVLRRVRAFVEDEVLPDINGYWERAELPWPLITRMGELGIVGEDIVGYGCPGLDPISCGLAMMELSRGDGSIATVLGVQSGLAMKSIAMLGSEEHKQRWLPQMARMEKLGAFALTEPDHGSDSVMLETTARREGDEYVIDGAKRWIGNGSVADVVVMWARDEEGQVGGFLIEKGTPGYDAEVIEGKGSLRAIWQAQILLEDVRVPVENLLPGSKSF
jgi:glutaryl-CoA dehydrogenase